MIQGAGEAVISQAGSEPAGSEPTSETTVEASKRDKRGRLGYVVIDIGPSRASVADESC